jgi:hypothetical protein
MKTEIIIRPRLIYPRLEVSEQMSCAEIEALLTADNFIADKLLVETEIRANILLTFRRFAK